MRTSANVFVALALACSSFASPAISKRHGPGKRGLCWPWYNSALDPGRLNDGQGTVNLIYDYGTYSPPSSNGLGGLNFIGMQRCMDSAARDLGFATVFTLNEPDVNGITPSAAASWYIQHYSSQTSGQGLDWVQQMVSTCAGQCYYHYINIHWYGQTFAQFQAHVQDANSRCPNQLAFFQQAFTFLDSASYVKMYFPFVATSPLFSSNDAAGTGFGVDAI
ncbi:hypothetical protein DFH06DRAFT_1272404 [Mycena polygramma]|nr:hypothetical protein DFH06DRAFT_1272404 [Mycena polygramma]